MTRREQEGARRILKQHGVLEEKLMGVPATLHFRVNLDRLIALLSSTTSSETPTTEVAGMFLIF
jgi:hypothetical protein